MGVSCQIATKILLEDFSKVFLFTYFLSAGMSTPWSMSV